MQICRPVVRTGAAVAAVASLLGSSAALAAPAFPAEPGTAALARAGILPPHNPSRSLPPSPDFLAVPACSTAKDGTYCPRAVPRATGPARRSPRHMPGQSVPPPPAAGRHTARKALHRLPFLEKARHPPHPAFADRMDGP